MQKIVYSILMTIILSTSVIKAEYLVFKNIKNKAILFDPVADEAVYKKIYTILQNYQWPMVIAAAPTLNQADVAALSKPNKPAAEESVIRKKIKELSPEYERELPINKN